MTFYKWNIKLTSTENEQSFLVSAQGYKTKREAERIVDEFKDKDIRGKLEVVRY